MLCISLSISLLCPCWILYPWCNYLVLLYWLSVGHANDTLQLSLLACISGCSFHVWMIIVVTIYSDCLFLVKPRFIVSFLLLDRIVLAPYAFQVFCLQWSYCVIVFSKYLSVWFKSFTDSRVRCEWVLFNCS